MLTELRARDQASRAAERRAAVGRVDEEVIPAARGAVRLRGHDGRCHGLRAEAQARVGGEVRIRRRLSAMKRRANLAGVEVGDGCPVRIVGAINVSPESFYAG